MPDPPKRDLPNPGTEAVFSAAPTLQADSLQAIREAHACIYNTILKSQSN